jgi:thymidylate synthase
MRQYLEHSKAILSSDISEFKDSKRTGMGTISLFGYQNRYELKEGLPLLTTKKLGWKSITHELLWFMRGEHNIKYLVDNNVPIWNDNAFQYQLKNKDLKRKFPCILKNGLRKKRNMFRG